MKYPDDHNGSAQRKVRLSRILSLSLAVATAAWIGVAPARAGTVVELQLDNVTFADGGTATGTFSIDESSGFVSNGDITVTDPFSSISPEVFNNSNVTSEFDGGGLNFAIFNTAGDGFGINFENPVGLTSDPITSGGYFYNGSSFSTTVNPSTLDSPSSIDPVAPEPASLALFSVGLAGLFMIKRRKKACRAVV